MKRKILILAMVPVLVFTVAGCTKKTENKSVYSGNYNFGGSTTVEPIIIAAIEELGDKFKDLNVSYDSVGSSTGIKGFKAGTYSLGAASRDLKDSEKDGTIASTAVALDGVAVIVNKSTVKSENLTFEQIGKIYSGQITNWKEVGGDDAEIVVYNRDEASGTRDCFKMTVKKIKASFKEDCPIVTSNGDMVSKIANTPYSIGYCGFGYIEKDRKIKAVYVDKVAPTVENVLNSTYAISRNLNIIHAKDLKENTFEKAFIDYLLSEDGQAIAEEEGFIPLEK